MARRGFRASAKPRLPFRAERRSHGRKSIPESRTLPTCGLCRSSKRSGDPSHGPYGKSSPVGGLNHSAGEEGSASSANWRRPSVCWRATAKARGQERWPQPGRRSRQQRWLLQRDQAGARALRPRNQLAASAAHRASAIRSLPWQAVRRSRKSPLHARALAQIMSAPPFPGTSASAASKMRDGKLYAT